MNKWTEQEVILLKDVYTKLDKERLIKLLPRHTWNSIKFRARVKHGLLRPEWENYSKDFLDFSEINTPEKAYIIGLWAADGYVGGQEYGYRMELGLKGEKDFLMKISSILGQNIKVVYKPKRNFYFICFRNQQISKQFIAHGVVPKKSLFLGSPIDVPEYLLPHWLRGYFDGDGALYISNNNLQLCFTGTYTIIKFIIGWVKKNFPNYRGKPHQKINAPLTFDAKFSGKIATKIMKFLYTDASIYLERKHRVFVYWLKTGGEINVL